MLFIILFSERAFCYNNNDDDISVLVRDTVCVCMWVFYCGCVLLGESGTLFFSAIQLNRKGTI